MKKTATINLRISAELKTKLKNEATRLSNHYGIDFKVSDVVRKVLKEWRPKKEFILILFFFISGCGAVPQIQVPITIAHPETSPIASPLPNLVVSNPETSPLPIVSPSPSPSSSPFPSSSPSPSPSPTPDPAPLACVLDSSAGTVTCNDILIFGEGILGDFSTPCSLSGYDCVAISAENNCFTVEELRNGLFRANVTKCANELGVWQ